MKYLLALLLLLTGCTQTVAPSAGPTSQSPSASSSETATPSATPICSPMGGTPVPCSAEEYQKVEEQNRLTEEAIALYRRWTKESTRLYRAGGTNKATPEMRQIMAGDALKSGLGIFQDMKDAGIRAVAGEVKIVSVGNDAASVDEGNTAIKACIDGRSLRFERAGKLTGRGTIAVEHVLFKPVDGLLKMWTAKSEAVASC